MFVNKDTRSRGLEESQGVTLELCLRRTANWTDPYPAPVLERIRDDVVVVREDLLGVGSKARFADFFVSQIAEEELVYVQPRVGWAGLSLAALAKRHGKRLTLFMPACKEISQYQLAAIEAGASPKFMRIAAMPNLNGAAKTYAARDGARFIPLGLRHRDVTAGIVRAARRVSDESPHEVWTVMSTGVLSRGLQLAWPDAKFTGVAVARNMQDGEVGRAVFLSYDRPFAQRCRVWPPIDSALNYDAKGLEVLLKTPADPTSQKLFWNVAGEPPPVKGHPEDWTERSNAPWGVVQ